MYVVLVIKKQYCLRSHQDFNSAMEEKKVHTDLIDDSENPRSSSNHGGWITFPFIIATMAGTSLAAGGWITNLIVYLTKEYNMKSIRAAHIFNVVYGCTLIFPIVGAIIADSFLGCFMVIWISALISLLGTSILVLTAAINQLRPPKCGNGSSLCHQNPSQHQLAILYTGLALASLGLAGTRYTIPPMGANQFDNPKHRSIFINWYIVTMYMSTVVSSTVIVYIQDNLSWALGFGISFAANVLGLAIFLAGRRFYRHLKPPQGTRSPFVDLARVLVASARKRKLLLSQNNDDYYRCPPDVLPTKSFRFLNRAALKRGEGEINPTDGSIAKPWELCTVQQVEDFKGLIKMLPLWSSGLFLCTPLVIQLSMTVIQALTMDRHLGNDFQIPASSMKIFILISTSVTVAFVDRLLFPLWEKITARCPITPLKRIGIGHLMTILSMAVSALAESRRLNIAHQIKNNQSDDDDNNVKAVVPMSVFGLVPGLAIAGIGEAFHLPGSIGFYYQEFPESLKSTSSAVVAMFIGIAFYLGNAVMDLVRKTTNWLPDDINEGRLDYLYWGCCVVGAVNYVYFLVCASFYQYQNVEKVTNHLSHPA